MTKLTITYTPSELYYRYKALCFTTAIKSIVIEDRYHRLNFKPYIAKIDYFYFNRLSKEYENIDLDKSKRYHELAKKFEARINYYMQDIANQLDEYHKNMTTDFGNEEESYRNWTNAVAEQFKKYYLTDDVTVTVEED